MSTGLRFKDKVAIVTGGCSGIGKGCVDVLVEHGGKVAILDINDDAGRTLYNSGTGSTMYIHCDVTNEEEVKKSIDQAVAAFGKVDCLVNVVGIRSGFFTIDELTVQGFRQLMDVNVVSMFAMSKYALPHLRKVKGNIINISSFSGTNGEELCTTYCSTKGAIRSFSKALAVDEAKHGVRVNTICPGPISTPLLRQLCDDDKVKEVESWSQLKRLGETKEIGLACLFLATDATFSTGIDLMCTGGCEIGYGKK